MSEFTDTQQLSLESYHSELVSFVARKIGSQSLAADIVQETYLRFLSRSQEDMVLNPRAFLYRIASNLVIDEKRRTIRHERVHISAIPAETIADSEPSANRILSGKQELEILRHAVSELPPRCKEVFVLRKFELLTQKEIATRLGISRNMVEKHLRKALLHCRQRLLESGAAP